jgi:hypothetical protein
MASLYDEKVLGAKDRIALARKLQEQGDNVAAGQMVSGWYVPNTGGAALGALQNIIGAYQESSAREDLDKAEMTRNKALANGLLQAGLPIPQEMRDSLATPEQTPSWGSRLWAGVTGGEQPQTVPRQEFTQQPAKDLTPDQRMSAISSLIPVAPEYAAPLQAHEQFMYSKQQDKETKQEALQNKKEIAAANAEERATRAEEQRIFLKNMQDERLAQQAANISLAASLRQNQGGGDPSFMPYQYPTGETGVFDRRTGKISPMPTLTGVPQPQPTGGAPTGVPQPQPTGGAPTGAPQPQPTGAPPVGGALGGYSVPPDKAAAFAALHPVLQEYARNLTSGMPLTNIPTKGGLRGQAQYAASLIDPEYFKKNIGGQADIASAKNAEKMFTTGQYGQNLTSVRTVGQHIDLYTNLVDSLQNGNVQTANAAAQKLAKEFGVSGPQTAESIAHIVGPEVSKAVIGNLSSAGERNEFSNMFSSAKSPEQIAQLKEYTHKLLGGRVQSIAATYNDAMKSTGRKFDYEGKGLGRYKPTEEEAPKQPAGQGGWAIRLKGQ